MTMSRREYECGTCGESHRTAYGAAMCCDALSNDLDDGDD